MGSVVLETQTGWCRRRLWQKWSRREKEGDRNGKRSPSQNFRLPTGCPQG